jgi:hypothetical protein
VARTEPEAITQIRGRLGRFIRIYPALETAFDNGNAARVFEVFLYFESDRLTRGAQYFALTDGQGAETSGLSLRQFRDGRDILCDPFNHLFQRQRFSTFGVTHYCANLDRIHGWLSANGFPGIAPPESPPKTAETPPNPSVYKSVTDGYTKCAPTGAQNAHPFQNLGTDLFVDDVARAREIELRSLLSSAGIEEPTRSEIAIGLRTVHDGVPAARDIIDRTLQEFMLAEKRGSKHIKSVNGLTISRLRELIKTTVDA